MDGDTLVRRADEAYEAIRALNHGTVGGPAMPAPVVYSLLGALRQIGPGLNQLLEQTAAGLVRSLEAFDVYDDNRDPAESVAMAYDALLVAGKHAMRLGECLAAAQVAINLQGYNLPSERDDDR